MNPSHKDDSLASSIDHTTSSQLETSCHNLLRADKEKDEWPVAHTFEDEENKTDNSSFFDCLCSGVSLLNCLLCQIMDGDQEKEVYRLPRVPSSHGLRIFKCSKLLTVQMANELYDMLPEIARIPTPILAFATYRDGWSMVNLHAKARNKEPVVVLLRALKSQVVIGGYSTASLSPPSNRIRGNGECFVFRLSSPAAAYKWVHNPAVKNNKQSCYNQFVVSSHRYIAFGASTDGSNNAIRIDSDLRTCDSGPSDTFQNEHLIPEELVEGLASPFEIQDIEVLYIPTVRRKVSST